MQCTHDDKLFCTICECTIQSCEKCYCRLDNFRLLRKIAQKGGRGNETSYMREMADRMQCVHFNTCRNCNCRIGIRLVKNPFRIYEDGVGFIPVFDLCELCSCVCFRCGTVDSYGPAGQYPVQYNGILTLRNLYSCTVCDLSWFAENHMVVDRYEDELPIGEVPFFAVSQLGENDLDIR